LPANGSYGCNEKARDSRCFTSKPDCVFFDIKNGKTS
jgi:hypothetical protein